MQDSDIIINKYIKIFNECVEYELALLDDKHRLELTQVIGPWISSTMLYSFGSPAELAKIVGTIFESPTARDFVYATAIRYNISLSGNPDISYTDLVKIITSWCLTGESLSRAAATLDRRLSQDEYIKQFVLIPDVVPQDHRDLLLGTSENIALVLDANRFLIVPIMFVLGGLHINVQQQETPNKN